MYYSTPNMSISKRVYPFSFSKKDTAQIGTLLATKGADDEDIHDKQERLLKLHFNKKWVTQDRSSRNMYTHA